MKNVQVRFVVLLGAVSIIGIIAVQVYFLMQAWNIREKQLHQTIVIGLGNVAGEICLLNNTTLPYGNPVKQVSSNYFVVDVNSVIDANILEYFLKKEFSKLNLHTDYEYAIYDCHTDKMVYGNYIQSDGAGKPVKISSVLPKYERYLYYFGIRFPALKSNIAGNMGAWFFFSVILLLSVIFFVYAIFVIMQQKRGSEMQKEFINNMTHEFKTPLSSISISADVLVQPDIVNNPERLQTYASVIKQENNRLIMQVEKILQVARIEKQGIHLKKEPIDLNILAETVAATFRTNAEASLRIETNTDNTIEPVDGDVLHLTNILFNLLDNAVKYAAGASFISIRTIQSASETILQVSDDGPGISPEYQKKVFRKFFRVPSGNVHDVKGFGLGLFYVKKTCEAHGWKVRLESRPGQGTTVQIRIPKIR
jgi:two-component system, OmpR family, phosphate regulon sensor histidine kinase PhoR